MKGSKQIEIKIHNQGTEAVKGTCHFCSKEVGGGGYCFGCKVFICGGCDNNTGVYAIFRHTASDHHIDITK